MWSQASEEIGACVKSPNLANDQFPLKQSYRDTLKTENDTRMFRARPLGIRLSLKKHHKVKEQKCNRNKL